MSLKTLAEETGISEDILQIIKTESGQEPKKLSIRWTGENDSQREILGVYLSSGKDPQIFKALRNKLSGKGYIVYLTDKNYNTGEIVTAIVKGNNIFDIIRSYQTNGVNYDLSTEDIIDKIQDWQKRCELEVIGVSFDWLDLDFLSLPADLNAFAEEMYEFCPDIIDQGYIGPPLPEDASWEDMEDAFDEQTTADLARFLEVNKEAFLWWD